MEHGAYKELLSALLYGELSGAEREAALAHMDGCADCRAYFEELIALRAALGGLEEYDAPGDFAAGVMARIRAGKAPETVKTRTARRGYAALAACAAMVLLAVYALPNTLRMGGNSAAADKAASANSLQATPTEAPTAPAGASAAPAPSSDWDYAYASGSGDDAGGMTKECAKEEEDGAADVPMFVENDSTAGAGENSGTYTASATDEKLCIANEDEFPMQPLCRPEISGEELPVLTLRGEGAAAWLAENGWQGESGVWYADAAALRELPDGLVISDGGAPEDYDGAVLVELGEAEP